MKKGILFLSAFLVVMLLSMTTIAQVTSSALTGSVTSATGQDLAGATIKALHLPSGTLYQTVAQRGGSFAISGMRPGGPYKVEIGFVGQKPVTFDNIFLELGDAFTLPVVLETGAQELTEVVVTGSKTRGSLEKNGASTTLDLKTINRLPTISRSLTDFTRLTPQAFGNSFGGRDGRLNNITIDGANLNNNFGLNNNPLPGAGNNPISIDAIEQVSVNLSPFDVKQGQFTGANIAAITRSGTNTFRGTVYHFWQNDNMVGDKVKDQVAAKPATQTKIFGGSLGGPIIKNKLFFFVNAEIEEKPPAAGITWTPRGGSGVGNVSDVPIADLQRVDQYVRSKFNFDPGAFDNFPAFNNQNYKFLAKVDWNINEKHKLTVKYSDFKGEQNFLPSGSGNIGGTFSGVNGAQYGPKFSQTAMSFYGTTYIQEDIVRSASLELNSKLGNNFNNQFLITQTKTSSDKIRPGEIFPFVDILNGTDNRNYISIGNEPFNGNNNSVINDIFTVTNNLTKTVGRHTLTAGVNYEFQEVGNMFMRGSQGYYLYRSVDDFVNDRDPMKFAITYSMVPGQDAIYSAQLKIGQLAAYVQDEFRVNSKFKLIYGIRADRPIYLEQPLENPANTALTYLDFNGNPTNFTTGAWPSEKILLSPRAGFRWDVEGNRTKIIRGGAGLFTGRIPFVYLTNIPTNSGMYQFTTAVTNVSNPGIIGNFRFNPSGRAYNPFYNESLPSNLFPTQLGTTPSTDVVFTDPNFKFPQVFRLNLATDLQLSSTWKLTLEGLYTKDINATYMYNANQRTPDATITTGSATRKGFSAATNAVRRVNPGTSQAIVLDNTNQGYQMSFTAQIEKSFSNGLVASLAYNFANAADVTANPGSQAASVWVNNPTSNTQNDFELAPSAFAIPHRVVGYVSYRKEFLKHLASTVSFFYDGRHVGRVSYIYGGDVNRDGLNQDLMYVPRSASDPSEIRLTGFTYPNGTVVTAAQMATLLDQFIDASPYLRKQRGNIVERNGALVPWNSRVDFRFLQDIFTDIGKTKNTLQFSFDCYNFLNLMSKNWGIRQQTTLINPLQVTGIDAQGIPSFRMNTFQGGPVTTPFQDQVSTATTYSFQLGVRYIFN